MPKIATFAMKGTHDKQANLRNLLACLDQAADAGARLVVFPEISLQGYRDGISVDNQSELLKSVYAGAEDVPGGPSVVSLASRARERNLHLIYGLTERGDSPATVYNTLVLTGPEGYIGRYRKVHVAWNERVIWGSGDDWPVFDTEIGRIGMLICYDQSWPESCRELMLGGAEILVLAAAWSRMSEDYDLYGRTRALENSRWFVSSNYAGALGSSSFFGLSQIIDPTGQTVVSTGETNEQTMVVADIDVLGGIEAALARFGGERLGRDRRPGSYRRIAAVPGRVDRPLG